MFDSDALRFLRATTSRALVSIALLLPLILPTDFIYSAEPVEDSRAVFLTSGHDENYIELRSDPDPNAPVMYRARPREVIRAVDMVGGRADAPQYRLVDGYDIHQRLTKPFFAEEPADRRSQVVYDQLEVPGYLDVTGDIAVFDVPGYIQSDCARSDMKARCYKLSNPNTEIKIIDSRLVITEDEYYMKQRYQNYYKIRYNSMVNGKDESVERWISSQYVSTTPISDPAAPSPQKEDCPPAFTNGTNQSDVEQVRKSNETTALDKNVVDQLLEKKAVGQCKLEDDPKVRTEKVRNEERKKFKQLSYKDGESPFRHMIKGHWDALQARDNTPTILVPVKSDGGPAPASDTRALTNDELFEIDSLARTLYGEMGKCVKNGPQYLAVVARIALNRAEKIKENPNGPLPFTKPDLSFKPKHDSRSTEDPNRPMPVIAHVVSTPSQFSLWNPLISKDEPNNKWLRQAFCPSADKDTEFWMGTKPRQEEQEIWRACLEMATKTVVEPERLKAETPGMDNLYFYTSGVGNGPGDAGKKEKDRKYKRVIPKAYGRYASNADCVEVWQEKRGSANAAKATKSRSPAKAQTKKLTKRR